MVGVRDKRAIDALASRSGLAAQVLRDVAHRPTNVAFDETQVARMLGLPASQETGVLEVLRMAQELGYVEVAPSLRWCRVSTEGDLEYVSSLLEAVNHYREKVHKDATVAEVVLTKPTKPSHLEEALSHLGWKIAELEITSEAFRGLASSTKHRLVVMTPFLDAAGADWLVSLLERTPADAERIVILRHLFEPYHPSYPSGYPAVKERLQQLRVRLFDYSLPRAGALGMETFHAKVVVRDNEQVYVGSSNMNRASLEYSMELGVLLVGQAAMAVSRVVSAILTIARPVN